MISSNTVDLPQGTIRYRETGSGVPLIFVHGLLVNGELWSGVTDHLAADGSFRCIVPDWPMGSHTIAMDPDADLSPPGLARLITDFMDALELERATVVGNDTGGAISQILTANHPDRVERLVLTNCDTLEHFPPGIFKVMPPIAKLPGGMTILAAPFRIGALGRATYSMLAKHPIPPENVRSWLEPAQDDADIRRDAGKVTAGANKRYTIEAAGKLRSFERPVRFVWGTEDRFFKLSHAERLAAMIPDTEIIEIPDAATFSPLDQPERVGDAVAGLVREPSAPVR